MSAVVSDAGHTIEPARHRTEAQSESLTANHKTPDREGGAGRATRPTSTSNGSLTAKKWPDVYRGLSFDSMPGSARFRREPRTLVAYNRRMSTMVIGGTGAVGFFVVRDLIEEHGERPVIYDLRPDFTFLSDHEGK